MALFKVVLIYHKTTSNTSNNTGKCFKIFENSEFFRLELVLRKSIEIRSYLPI